MKPTHWISSRGPKHFGMSVVVPFLEEGSRCVGPVCTNVQGLWSTKK